MPKRSRLPKNVGKSRKTRLPCLPAHIKSGDLQWSGDVKGKHIEVYYDDVATQNSTGNEYAVFSNDGLIGWVQVGWTMTELHGLLEKWSATAYKKGLEEFKKMMGAD